MIRQIRKRKFNIILSPHQSHRTGILCIFSGAQLRYGYETAGFARFAYDKLLKRPPGMPEILRLLKFLDETLIAGAENLSTRLQLFETENSFEEANTILSLHQAKLPVLMAPSSIWPTKRWTPWGFAELAEKIINKYNCTIFLIGSKNDISVSKDVMNFVNLLLPEKTQEKIVDICGKTSLPALYSLMKRSRLLVSNDSAPVHIGSAAEIPLVAIFGPTVRSLGYAPISPASTLAELTDLECRPCGTHGAKTCPLGHFRCMKSLSSDDVMEKVIEVLEIKKQESQQD
ncbi:MAG: glycosyltransferase family 9 protein [Spirochaetia bacterium]|nr:glycosyltransferase family 9 protein [Spirochaetia bacterium]